MQQTQAGLEISLPAGYGQALDTIVVLELDRSALGLPAVDVPATTSLKAEPSK